MLDKVSKFFNNSKIRFSYLTEMGFTKWMPDKFFLKREYKLHMGKDLSLENPQTFNEKLQWLKIHDRKEEYTMMVDKYAVKQYVAERIGEEYIIPTLGVWNDFDEIDFERLPNQFVLKCTHDSGGIVICREKKSFDKKAAKKKMEHYLKRKYFYIHREWPYKNVQPRIIAEMYITDNKKEELNDYKLMCFDGKVKATFVCSNRFSESGLNVTFFDNNWEKLPFERHYPASKTKIDRPKSFTKMIELAEKLSQNVPFLRVDFYEINEKPVFGELTFFPGSGYEEFTPEIWDKKMGEYIKLPM